MSSGFICFLAINVSKEELNDQLLQYHHCPYFAQWYHHSKIHISPFQTILYLIIQWLLKTLKHELKALQIIIMPLTERGGSGKYIYKKKGSSC